MVDASTIVPTSVQRNLADKLYEKRKNAALEIEGIVKQLASNAEHDKIRAVIHMLSNEFTFAPQVNHRKGGLIGLAAVTVGLTSEAGSHLELEYYMPDHTEAIVGPVLLSFIDQDSRVRYYACEALYNIAKVVRGEFIVYFNKIFDALCKLSADSDANVQSAAHLLDRLVKDIVTESDSFSIEEFIPLLRERMNVLNPYVRQFLVGWITVLDSVPDIDMLGFLPDFLDGLFNMLSDSSLEIRQQADAALSEFLQEIKNSPSVDYGRMAEILVRRAGSGDEFTRLTAIVWINEFVKLGGEQLVPYYADILGAILPCISDKEEKIRVVACETNEELRGMRPEPSEGFDVGAILRISRREINSDYEPTRIEALHWLQSLVVKYRNEVLIYLEDIFSSLLNALADTSEVVILLVLEVYACVAKEPIHFTNLVKYLLDNFKSNTLILEKRGPLVVRQLCVLLGSEKVYREFSTLLQDEPDLSFANIMVQALNLILVTSSELAELRGLLKQSLVNSSGKDLLLSLYPSWCHCPMATITLCLLAQAYHHTSCVIESLREEDINVKFLVQLDKLVRLLETPIFSYLRLQLLEPEKYTWLLKSLYGLLMLLPQLSSLYVEQQKGYITKQSSAFKVLRTRLKTIPSNYSKLIPITISKEIINTNQEESKVYDSIDFDALLEIFTQTQDEHRKFAKSKPAPVRTSAPPVAVAGTSTGMSLNLSIAGSSSQDKYWEFRKLQLEMLHSSRPDPDPPVSSPHSQEVTRPDESRPPSPGPVINRPPSRASQ